MPPLLARVNLSWLRLMLARLGLMFLRWRLRALQRQLQVQSPPKAGRLAQPSRREAGAEDGR